MNVIGALSASTAGAVRGAVHEAVVADMRLPAFAAVGAVVVGAVAGAVNEAVDRAVRDAVVRAL